MITAEENDVVCFPLYRPKNPLAINNFDFEFLILTKRDVVNVLDKFNIMNSREIVELDRGDDYKIGKYLYKFIFYMCSQLHFSYC